MDKMGKMETGIEKRRKEYLSIYIYYIYILYIIYIIYICSFSLPYFFHFFHDLFSGMPFLAVFAPPLIQVAKIIKKIGERNWRFQKPRIF